MFKNKTSLIVTLSVLATLLPGCGSNTSTVADTLGGQKYLSVDAGDLVRTDNSISGSGSIVFNSPLSDTDSNNSYRLTFTLQDGASVSLVANSTEKLESGVSVKFSRSGTKLSVSVGTGTKELSGVDASGTLTYQIDVHNKENPAHILVWDSSVKSGWSEDNAKFNSKVDAPASGHGAKYHWGLSLSKATVTEALLGSVKLPD